MHAYIRSYVIVWHITYHPYILCGAPVLYQKYNNPSGVLMCVQIETLMLLQIGDEVKNDGSYTRPFCVYVKQRRIA